MIARGKTHSSDDNGKMSENDSKDSKILLTEVISLVLKPTKDAKMHQAYVDCLVSLTKHFCDNPNLVKFVCFTYQELLQKFLGGRGSSAHSLNQQFFTTIFEECNSTLGKSLMKPHLKYILPKGNSDLDSEASGAEEKKANTPL